MSLLLCLVFVSPLNFSLGLTAAGRASDWPQFRGPGGSATTAEKGLPAEWGSDKNIAWKTTVPGYGWSSPIVWGDKVFVTSAFSEKQKKPSGGLLRASSA